MGPTPTFRLKLLGSPSLSAADGAPLEGRAGQRHRLALLAMLARSPSAGVSRDVLMAHLWPESDLEQARNLLKVSVYVLRRALGDDAIRSASDGLRLASEVIDVDVLAFDATLEAGERERAVGIYRGPFLEGFHLKDAPDFERWADRERARLADAFATALDSLAEAAEAKNDAGGAVRWWKSRAAHDPYDSRVALRLMRAFDAAGNRAGALQHARIHTRLVREELEVEPPAEIAALLELWRAEPEASAPVVRRRPEPPGPERTSQARSAAVSVDRSGRPGRARTGRRWLSVASVSAGVLAMVLAVARPWGGERGATASARPSVAVLPLVNRGDETRDAVLADGMTDELIAMLAGRGVRVISSTSVFALRGRQVDVRAIADSLGVSFVLEGDWSTPGSNLRVRLRLVDGRDGSIRWSREYQRELGEVFAVEREIASDVVRELGEPLGETPTEGTVRRPTTSVTAWELYRRAGRPEVLRSDVAAREALALVGRAVELDSTFAGAHAGVARLLLRIGPPEDPDMSRADRLALARRHAVRATELDGSLAEAHGTLGIVEMFLYHFGPAEAHLKWALELDPSSSSTREWLTQLYVWEGRFPEALEEAERALRDDPLSASSRAEVGRALMVNDRCDEALAVLEPLAALEPPLLRAGPIGAQCEAQAGRWEEATLDIRRGSGAAGDHGRANLAYYLARSGKEAEATVTLRALLEHAEGGGGNAFWIATVYAGLGRLDECFEWLERSVDEYSFRYEIMEPMFSDLRGDPRFQRLLERVGVDVS